MDAVCKFDQLRIKDQHRVGSAHCSRINSGSTGRRAGEPRPSVPGLFEAARLMRIAEISQKQRIEVTSKLERLAKVLDHAERDGRPELAGCFAGRVSLGRRFSGCR